MQYISDPPYPPREENSMETGKLRPRKAKVDSRTAVVKAREDCGKQQAPQEIALRSIGDGEVLFKDYEMKYSLE